VPAAKARARRARWRRIEGNDGVARIEVPVEALTPSPPTEPATLPATDPTTAVPVLPMEHAAVAALVAELRGERDKVRSERDKAREEIETLRRELQKAGERAAGAEGEAGALREALADLSARLDRAEAVLALPWWKRLFG
jgi:hypothetical protein